MLCRCSECLNYRSPSPVPTGHGHGCGCGHGGGHATTHVALNLEEEAPPTGEQHMEEPILEEPDIAWPRGEDAPPRGDNAPPPPPLLSEVMDRPMRLMETLAEGLLHRNEDRPTTFRRS